VAPGQYRQKVSQTPISINSWAQWYVSDIPSYRRLSSQVSQFQASQGKKFCKTPNFNRKKLGIVVLTYHPSNSGKHKIEGKKQKKTRPHLQNKKGKKD
jgi:hypothetical protein